MQVDVFAELVEEFTAPHSRIESGDDEWFEVRCCCLYQEGFFLKREDRLPVPSKPWHTKSAQWVYEQDSAVKCVEEQVPKHSKVVIDRGMRHLADFYPVSPVLARERFGDLVERRIREVQQQLLDALFVVRLCVRASEKACSQFFEAHLWIDLGRCFVTPDVEFVSEVEFTASGLDLVSGLHRPAVPLVVDPDVSPIDSSSFVKTHAALLPWYRR